MLLIILEKRGEGLVKKKWKFWLKILLVLALLAGLIYVGIRQLEYYRGAREYADAEEVAALPMPETEQESDSEEEGYQDPYIKMFESMDLDALKEVNDEIIGWISIPYTEVSYPILQAEDNDYYLKRTWKKAYNSVGSIFMECQNASDFSDFNTIIYGHNMRNGSMFGELKQYKSLEYWKEHPSIYIVDENGARRYDIFAAHEVGVRTITYGLEITKPETKEKFIEFALSGSVIDTGVVPTVEDQVITLSTCTGNGYSTRWVVQGVLNEGAPAWIEEE